MFQIIRRDSSLPTIRLKPFVAFLCPGKGFLSCMCLSIFCCEIHTVDDVMIAPCQLTIITSHTRVRSTSFHDPFK